MRLYEELELIPKPKRRPNGYRIFTDFHLEQFRLARLAFQIEVMQNGSRKQAVQIIKTSATGDFEKAITLALEYAYHLRHEYSKAEEAAEIAKQISSRGTANSKLFLTRKKTSEYLGISADTLRNWEMNGLIEIKRKENGYRVYTEEDIRRLKIIGCLRQANYSLEAILHMLYQLSENPNADILTAINTPKDDADIVSVCDRLLASLSAAENNAREMIAILQKMKTEF